MAHSNGWYGVDLDGTLAHYEGWVSDQHIGPPVPLMAARVKQWLAEGKDVRIVTARVFMRYDPVRLEVTLNQTAITLVQNWTEEHFGVRLKVVCFKDFSMIELWDDRCKQVVPNTGELVGEMAS